MESRKGVRARGLRSAGMKTPEPQSQPTPRKAKKSSSASERPVGRKEEPGRCRPVIEEGEEDGSSGS